MIDDGDIVEGALFSEPMRVEGTPRPNGPDTWSVALVGVKTERFRRVTLTKADVESLRVTKPGLSFQGEPAPSGVMFASGIRLRGLELLARHRIREGTPLCLQVMDIDRWGKRHRITECLKILSKYGGAAKAVLPELRELEKKLLSHPEAKGLQPQIDLIRKVIADIEAAKDAPQLRSLGLPGGRR